MPPKVKSIKGYKEYKQAKVHLEHLEAILKVLNLTQKGLSHFSVYIPVYKILDCIKEQKTVLESHVTKQKLIIKEFEL